MLGGSYNNEANMNANIDVYRKRVWDYLRAEYNETIEQFNGIAVVSDHATMDMLRVSIDQSINEHYKMQDNIALTAGTVARVHLLGFIENSGYVNDSFDGPMNV